MKKLLIVLSVLAIGTEIRPDYEWRGFLGRIFGWRCCNQEVKKTVPAKKSVKSAQKYHTATNIKNAGESKENEIWWPDGKTEELFEELKSFGIENVQQLLEVANQYVRTKKLTRFSGRVIKINPPPMIVLAQEFEEIKDGLYKIFAQRNDLKKVLENPALFVKVVQYSVYHAGVFGETLMNMRRGKSREFNYSD